jgi:hypothetical protein
MRLRRIIVRPMWRRQTHLSVCSDIRATWASLIQSEPSVCTGFSQRLLDAELGRSGHAKAYTGYSDQCDNDVVIGSPLEGRKVHAWPGDQLNHQAVGPCKKLPEKSSCQVDGSTANRTLSSRGDVGGASEKPLLARVK